MDASMDQTNQIKRIRRAGIVLSLVGVGAAGGASCFIVISCPHAAANMLCACAFTGIYLGIQVLITRTGTAHSLCRETHEEPIHPDCHLDIDLIGVNGFCKLANVDECWCLTEGSCRCAEPCGSPDADVGGVFSLF